MVIGQKPYYYNKVYLESCNIAGTLKTKNNGRGVLILNVIKW